MKSMEWKKESLFLLNQVALPHKEEYIECKEYRRVAEAIRRLEVRGAPAIGAAAAYGFVLGARETVRQSDFREQLAVIGEELKGTRPTAVNLFWAVNRMLQVLRDNKECSNEELLDKLEAEAEVVAHEDSAVNAKIAAHGAELFTEPISILTHCNAGALATVEWGTALGVIRQAWSNGKIVRVFADETRPLLQGGRLTAWELMQDEIPVTLITDNMAGWVMRKNMVQAVIVGADRITLNGDVANKIGTYGVAVLAKEHNIPFYVAAPTSTFDFSMKTGEAIPIEERDKQEVTHFAGHPMAPEGVDVFNPAFDVTPNELITGIITEYGVLRPSYTEAIEKLITKKAGI